MIIRIIVTSICIDRHQCSLCGAEVDNLATHGLSCRRSEGRHPRHAALNEIIHHSLSSAHIPSRLEPSGVYRTDGKRPDGISMVPWRHGRVLVWDATCPDTFAPSHVSSAATSSSAIAKQAEQAKKAKYAHLDASHYFVPLVVETSGVLGPEALLSAGPGTSAQGGNRRTKIPPVSAAAIVSGSAAGKCRGGAGNPEGIHGLWVGWVLTLFLCLFVCLFVCTLLLIYFSFL